MTTERILSITDLNVCLNDKTILDQLNLNINLGEIHIIMGPNGVGKSTLAKILAGGYNNYLIHGKVIYNNLDLFSLLPEELSLNGIFLSFQHPVEIAGLSNFQFLKSFVNAKRKYETLDPIDNNDFLLKVKNFMNLLNMKEELLYRSVNEGFSGGEKKRNEILQMLLLNPKLVILDEIDSGLDIDSLKFVFKSINSFKNKKNSLLIITHYNRVLDYIDADFVHILLNGRIVKTGDKNLAFEVEKNGYSFLNNC